MNECLWDIHHIQGVPSELRLGFDDLDFECSTVCPTLLGVVGIRLEQLGIWASWWNSEIKVNQPRSTRT